MKIKEYYERIIKHIDNHVSSYSMLGSVFIHALMLAFLGIIISGGGYTNNSGSKNGRDSMSEGTIIKTSTSNQKYAKEPGNKENIWLENNFGKKLNPELERIIKQLNEYKNTDNGVRKTEGDYVLIQIDGIIKKIPKQGYFREIPDKEILRLGKNLFYVFTEFPSLEGIISETKIVKEETQSSDDALQVYLVDEKKLEKMRNNWILKLSDSEIKKILDGLMKEKSEEDMCKRFRKEWLDKYDPNKGSLPKLAKGFLEFNTSGYIYNLGPISFSFGWLEEIYFKKHSQKELFDYIRKNPFTKTSAELLLDYMNLLNIEKISLIYPSIINEDAEKVLAGEKTQEDIYQKEAKAFVIKEMYDLVISELFKKKEFYTLDMAIQKYDDEEMKVIDHLSRIGKTSRNRGLYIVGMFKWEGGLYTKALEKWRLMDKSHKFPFYQKIRKIIDNVSDMESLKSKIDEAIRENRKVYVNSYDRQLEFRKWDKRSEFIKQLRSRN